MPETIIDQQKLEKSRARDAWYKTREQQVFLAKWGIPALIIDPDKFAAKKAALEHKRFERSRGNIAFDELSVTEAVEEQFAAAFGSAETWRYTGFNNFSNQLGVESKVACRTQYYYLGSDKYLGLSLLTEIMPTQNCDDPNSLPLLILEHLAGIDFSQKVTKLTPEQHASIKNIMFKIITLENNLRENWGIDIGLAATLEQYLNP